MIPQPTAQEIEKRLAGLPKNISDIFWGEETADIIYNIGTGHHLMIDKIGELAKIVSFVLVGLMSPKQVTETLATTLKIDSVAAAEIAGDINNQIFSKIRVELQKLDNEPAGAPVVPAPKPSTPPRAPGARR
ncbi:MAG: hypothetical protein HY979_03460, partial [Candidatus Magasanikbacteria bacterium]|nr:hypothetical protein [Candidatus Magasanikbacteria bacterium]